MQWIDRILSQDGGLMYSLPNHPDTSVEPRPAATGETFYVHLVDGAIDIVSAVTRHDVTDTAVVLFRHKGAPVIYPRSEVYFASCEEHEPPCQY